MAQDRRARRDGAGGRAQARRTRNRAFTTLAARSARRSCRHASSCSAPHTGGKSPAFRRERAKSCETRTLRWRKGDSNPWSCFTAESEKVPPERGQKASGNAALCQRVGPGEGSVAALSTAQSISSTVISGVMLTRTTPAELPTSDMASPRPRRDLWDDQESNSKERISTTPTREVETPRQKVVTPSFTAQEVRGCHANRTTRPS
jgi:hypothetical protein